MTPTPKDETADVLREQHGAWSEHYPSAALSDRAAESFQSRVHPWLMACFGEMIAGDREERNHRFLEEALELVQACGCNASEAHQLVDYVYGRPIGEPAQEVGGVMVTLAALCLANDLDMHGAAETELARIWTKVEAIRAKQAAKPKHSPLPMVSDRAAEREGAWIEGELVGLAVTLTIIVAYFAFWHLSPVVTFVVGCVALVGLGVAAWVLGGEDPSPPSGKSPRQPIDRAKAWRSEEAARAALATTGGADHG